MSTKRTKENTLLVYHDGDKAYLRLAPLETPRFRHGISLATPVPEEHLEEFREAVWQYLKEAFEL